MKKRAGRINITARVFDPRKEPMSEEAHTFAWEQVKPKDEVSPVEAFLRMDWGERIRTKRRMVAVKLAEMVLENLDFAQEIVDLWATEREAHQKKYAEVRKERDGFFEQLRMLKWQAVRSKSSTVPKRSHHKKSG